MHMCSQLPLLQEIFAGKPPTRKFVFEWQWKWNDITTLLVWTSRKSLWQVWATREEKPTNIYIIPFMHVSPYTAATLQNCMLLISEKPTRTFLALLLGTYWSQLTQPSSGNTVSNAEWLWLNSRVFNTWLELLLCLMLSQVMSLEHNAKQRYWTKYHVPH